MSIPPSPLDGTAVIPLPPGMTMEQFFIFQSSLVTISITAAIAFGIVVWDYFHLLRDEYKLYRSFGSAEWKSLVPWSFMAIRCSGVVAILAAFCISSFQSDHCQLGASINQCAAVLVVASSGVAFGYRGMKIWNKHKIIATIIGGTYICMVGCWIAVAPQFRAINRPPTPFGSNCHILPFVSWSLISHGGSALFNTSILIIATLKFVDQRSQQSRIGYIAYRNSIVYIAITTATSIIALVVQTLDQDHQMIKQIFLPYSTLITATMGARVFLTFRPSETHRHVTYTQNSSFLAGVPTEQGCQQGVSKATFTTLAVTASVGPGISRIKLAPNSRTASPLYQTSGLDSPQNVSVVNLAPDLYTTFPPPPSDMSAVHLEHAIPKGKAPPRNSNLISSSLSKFSLPDLSTGKFGLPTLGGSKKKQFVRESGWI